MRDVILLGVLSVGLLACNKAGPGTTGCEPHCAMPAAFDACGGKIMTGANAIDPDEYVKQATAWSADIIDCRLGPDYEAYHGTGSADTRPTAYKPPDQHTPLGRNNMGMTFQLGGPATADSMNIFGSVIDQVLYAPDDVLNPGVDRISTYDWSSHVIVEMPERVWWGTPDCWWPNCHANPDPATHLPAWQAALGHAVNHPIAAARTYMSWSNDALVVFQGGFVGATGSQTSDDHYPTFVFPPNKVPTAIATTSYHEFALVTIWDTDAKKGQVAVLALEGKGLATATHGWYYIGFPSVGSYTNIKLLGYIDLPDMATPTAIDAAGDNASGLVPGGIQLGLIHLDTQAVRDEFMTGKYKEGIVATSGYAVVTSRWENKATFIDLQPLFAYYRSMYVTTQANFDLTQDATKWPYTFETQPDQKPIVLTTVAVDHPQAVLAGRHRYDANALTKAYIASLDGTITAYDVTSLDNTAAAVASDVKVAFTTKVGRNPTTMIWPRETDPKDPKASPYDFNDSFVVVSRGDREIDFVTTDKSSGTVFRSFTDSRLGDPVDIDIGERAYVMAVADWKAKKIVTYRFAPTPAEHITPQQSFGLGTDGKAEAECGGELPIEGHPFKLSSTNVN